MQHIRNVKETQNFRFGTFCEKSESHISFLLVTAKGGIAFDALEHVHFFCMLLKTSLKTRNIYIYKQLYGTIKATFFVGGTFCEKFKTRF